jgi:hypothetical protein
VVWLLYGLAMKMNGENTTVGTHNAVTVSPGASFRIAMVLAVLADMFQIAIFPFLIEGAASPAEDVLDLCISGVMVYLLGWHWEFLPSFAAKLIPGIDMVPFWTLAVANVYRKSKRDVINTEHHRHEHLTLERS